MRYFKYLKDSNQRIILIDSLAENKKELNSGMAYLEKGLEREVVLEDENSIPRLKVKLPTAFLEIKTVALEINTDLEILEILDK